MNKFVFFIEIVFFLGKVGLVLVDADDLLHSVLLCYRFVDCGFGLFEEVASNSSKESPEMPAHIDIRLIKR